MNEQIMEWVKATERTVIAHRRKLHGLAEVGGKEFRTHDYICSVLEELGIPYENIGDTGILAKLDTGKKGPGIALRADIDALPIREKPRNKKRERTCISEDKNTCHACGHDAHTAMLLGSIQILAGLYKKNPKAFCGNFYFCFEAGEENGHGIYAMLEALDKKQIDTVWAVHVYAGLSSGRLSIQKGPRMAGNALLDFKVKGKGGHASRPDQAMNPVYVAAEIVTAVPGLFVNQLDANKRVTYGVTSITGSNMGNVIPDEAKILGTLRFFDVEEGKKAVGIVKKAAENIADMYHCTLEFEERFGVCSGPVINNEGCAQFAEECLPEILEPMDAKLCVCNPWYASDSYRKYLEKYPGIYAFLGIHNEEYGSGAGHHNEFFDVDENTLKTGVAATVKYAVSWMEKYA